MRFVLSEQEYYYGQDITSIVYIVADIHVYYGMMCDKLQPMFHCPSQGHTHTHIIL